MFSNVRMLIANNRKITQELLVLAFLLIIATSGTAFSNGISNLSSSNQVQAQQQEQIKINKLWETASCLEEPRISNLFT